MFELSDKVPRDIAYKTLKKLDYKLGISGSKIIERHE